MAFDPVARSALGGAANDAVARGQGYVEGNWYLPYPCVVATGAVMSSTSTRLIPWVVRQKCTVTQLGARVVTASGNCIFAIYASSPGSKLPTGAPLAKSATGVPLSASGNVASTLDVAVVLNPGLFWLAIQCDNATATFQAHTNAFSAITPLIGGTQTQVSPAAAALGANLLATSTYGTWPELSDAAVTLSASAAFALIQVYIASVDAGAVAG